MTTPAKANPKLLYLITWLTDFSAMLLIFTVSRYLAETQASLLKMGVAGAGISLTQCVSSVVFGRLSDRFGRRRLIFTGALVVLLSTVGCLTLSGHEWLYFLSYWSFGLGTGMIYPALIAWLTQGEEAIQGRRSIGGALIRFCLAWNVGLIFGQVSGGWLFEMGRDWPLVLAILLTAVNLVVVLMTGRRSSKPAASAVPTEVQELRQLAISAGFARMNWIANLGGAFAMSMIFHLFPKLVVSLGVPPDQQGTILAIMRVTVIGTYLLMHHTRFWHYRFAVVLSAQASAVAGLAVLAWARTGVELTAGLAGLALLLGYNYFAGLYYSNTSRGDEQRGFASGMHEATLGLGFAAGALGGGIIGDLAGERAPYLLAIAVIVALVAVQIVVYLRQVRPLARSLDGS